MGKPAALLFCLGAITVGVVGCGINKSGLGTIDVGVGSGGVGGFAGAGGFASGGMGGAAGGTAGHGGFAAGGAAGNGAGGYGGSALPQGCVPAVSVAPDGGPQPYARCLAGATPTPEICDDSVTPCHCPIAYAEMSSCACFVHDIDQECPNAGGAGGASPR